MTTSDTATSGGTTSIGAVLTAVLGVLVIGYGLLFVQESVLWSGHIVAIGLSLVLSGLFATERFGDRFGLSAAGRRRASLAFGALAVLLVVAFVVINTATFEAGEAESGS